MKFSEKSLEKINLVHFYETFPKLLKIKKMNILKVKIKKLAKSITNKIQH